jgi:hypothetical protein
VRGASSQGARGAGAALAVMLLVAVVARIPVLWNAAPLFNSDEAVDALVVHRMMTGGAFSFYNWDATSYGVAEGLLSVPFAAALGYEPIAFKLAAVTTLLVFVVMAFALARRLYGDESAVAAAAAAAVFSPQIVQWSTMASGGYLLVVALGTAGFVLLARSGGRGGGRSAAFFGAFCGFGMYVYSLFLVYLLVLFPLFALLVWERTAAGAKRTRERLRTAAIALVLFTAGFAVGWMPKIRAILRGTLGERRLTYGLARPGRMLFNVRLLLGEALPAFLGVNPTDRPELARFLGANSLVLSVLGAVFVAILLLGLAAALRPRPGIPPNLRRIELALVGLVPLNIALFILSPNPQDLLSNRYLLPSLTSLVVLGAGLAARATHHRVTTAALVVVFLAYPALRARAAYRRPGLLDGSDRLARIPDACGDLVAYLRRENVTTGYGSYWISYIVDMRSKGDVRLGLFRDWDRDKAYTKAANAASEPAYVFFNGDPRQTYMESALPKAGRPFRKDVIGPYVVYRSVPGTGRLLPPD